MLFDFAIVLELGVLPRVEPNLPLEESPYTLHIPFEIILSVDVRSGDHLGEVDQSDVFLVIHQQIELVEISMYQPITRKSND
jgi:hypothetical protein